MNKQYGDWCHQQNFSSSEHQYYTYLCKLKSAQNTIMPKVKKNACNLTPVTYTIQDYKSTLLWWSMLAVPAIWKQSNRLLQV